MTDKETERNSVRQIRLRKRLDDWFLGLIVVLVVLGGVGAVFAYQIQTADAIETQEEQVGTWNEQPSLSHHAEVARTNPLYEQGQTLPDQSLYFTHISPELAGAYEYSYGATGDGEFDVELGAVLQKQAVDDDGDPYWQVTEPLNQTHQHGLSPGESVSVPFAVNVTEAVMEIEQIEEGLGASVGTTEVAILVNTHVTGTVNGERVATTHQSRVEVEPDGETYSVESVGVEGESHETVRTVESKVSHGPVQSYGPFGLIVGSVVGIVGLTSLKRWGNLTPTKRELDVLAHAQQRAEFDDWISPGPVPEEYYDSTRIELESLEALVDVAIDTNSRVIEDSNTGLYVVVGDNWHYSYTRSHQTGTHSTVADGDRLSEPLGPTEQTAPENELKSQNGSVASESAPEQENGESVSEQEHGESVAEQEQEESIPEQAHGESTPGEKTRDSEPQGESEISRVNDEGASKPTAGQD